MSLAVWYLLQRPSVRHCLGVALLAVFLSITMVQSLPASQIDLTAAACNECPDKAYRDYTQCLDTQKETQCLAKLLVRRVACSSECLEAEDRKTEERRQYFNFYHGDTKSMSNCEQLCQAPSYEALLDCVMAGGDRTSCLPEAKAALASCQSDCDSDRQYEEIVRVIKDILAE